MAVAPHVAQELLPGEHLAGVRTNVSARRNSRALSATGRSPTRARRVRSSNHAISGSDDDPLYQDLRRRMYEYRFDGLAPGIYQVELRFAELQRTRPNTHLFDVILENSLVLPAHDIALEVGSFAADDHAFFIRVDDGSLDVRLIRRAGFGQPTINAVRVTSRPDQ